MLVSVVGGADSTDGNEMDETVEYFEGVPVYWVLFRCDTEHGAKYSPVVRFDKGKPPPAIETTEGIFLLSRDFASALQALWYALHLPRNVFDTIETPPRFLRGLPLNIDAAHHILLLPHNAPRNLFRNLPHPSLILASSDVADDAVKLGADWQCAVLLPEQATPESLPGVWVDVGRRLNPTGTTSRLSPPKWVQPQAEAGMVLTTDFLLRHLGSEELIETLGPAEALSRNRSAEPLCPNMTKGVTLRACEKRGGIMVEGGRIGRRWWRSSRAAGRGRRSFANGASSERAR